MKNQFGKRLRELRLEKSLLQKDVAKILERQTAAISKWEQGIREPSLDDLIKLSEFFDCSVDYLIGKVDY